MRAVTVRPGQAKARLITRRVPLSCWREAFENRGGDIKVVLDFSM